MFLPQTFSALHERFLDPKSFEIRSFVFCNKARRPGPFRPPAGAWAWLQTRVNRRSPAAHAGARSPRHERKRPGMVESGVFVSCGITRRVS